MTVAENKELIRRFVKKVFEERRPDAVDELVAADFVSHTWPAADGDSRAYLRQAAERMSKMPGEVSFTVADLIAEGNQVAARVHVKATVGGQGYEIGEIHIFRVRDGLIVEHWHQYDALGMQRQLNGALSVELGAAWQAAENALPADRARYTIGTGSISARRYFAAAHDKSTGEHINVEAQSPLDALRDLTKRLKQPDPFAKSARGDAGGSP